MIATAPSRFCEEGPSAHTKRGSHVNILPSCTAGRRRAPAVFLGVLIVAVALLGALALPVGRADAMEVVKCTGRPNSEDDPTAIMGATESRITFEASVAEGEGVSSLTLRLPEGTTFGTDDLAVTLLTGDDLMTRNELDYTESVDGQDLTLDFAEPIMQQGHLNILVYDVFFPTDGGEMQVEATYELADGTEAQIEGIPSIPVEGISFTESLSQWLEEQPWIQAWNANRFLHLFFDPALLVTSFPVVLTGFFTSIAIVAVAFPLAIPMGLLLALMRISKLRLLRGIATTYVNIVRGTPLFLQIYVAFFGLPLAGIQIPNFVLGVTVMCMNSGAYMCEIFRAGILSISKGQTEAARSLGMNGAQTMFYVILPQMFRIVIPNLTSEFIVLYKDTSLLAAVGIMELVMYARTIVASTGSITPYIVAALFYLVITLPLSKVTRHLEDRVRGHRSRKHAVELESADEKGASDE
ncbi:amino acid ABC transporter permease [Olsenella sp. DSM 107455]|uniref:Amino acid ABC transporter permease n=1 Tax=Thermophilibacter gallinarum TaxID=2779357 RepID=A0ABR9QSQ7_9ACTN|nr:amino acid ABC transporter permease [Thermophilibacter gallinarum]